MKKKLLVKVTALALMAALLLVPIMGCIGGTELRVNGQLLLQDRNLRLVNEDADEATVELWEYMLSIYGRQSMIGFFSNDDLREARYIYELTATLEPPQRGLEPSHRGFDMIWVTRDRRNAANPEEYESLTVNNAIEWATTTGGVVTFCWHWLGPEENGYRGSAFTRDTTFRISQLRD